MAHIYTFHPEFEGVAWTRGTPDEYGQRYTILLHVPGLGALQIGFTNAQAVLAFDKLFADLYYPAVEEVYPVNLNTRKIEDSNDLPF